MLNKIISCVFLTLFLSLSTSTFLNAQTVNSPISKRVVVSIAPLGFFVRQIVDDEYGIDALVPQGACMESYEPTIKQLRGLSQADLYVKVGHPAYTFESKWIEPLMEKADPSKLFLCSDGLSILPEDPHLWLSPRAVKSISQGLAKRFAEINPTMSNNYQKRLAEFIIKVDALDRELLEMFSRDTGKSFLVFHPAWGYFARDYGLVQLAIEREGKEPSVADLVETINTAKAKGVKSVFVEPNAVEGNAQVIADSLNARIETLNPLADEWLVNMRESAVKIKAGLSNG